jgi:RNA polymerase sigma-70 factor (ECF subfamily)
MSRPACTRAGRRAGCWEPDRPRETERHIDAFEQQMLPHLAAALTLARYLLRETADAEDAVQEAYLQAVRHFGGFRGENARAWLLTIVRRVCYAWTERERRFAWTPEPEEVAQVPSGEDDPETSLVRRETQEQLARAVDGLPLPFREVIVMREIQQLSYKEIAAVTGVPVGTVMSRLARARGRLQRVLAAQELEG